MEYNHLVHDFVDRTLKNLKFVQDSATPPADFAAPEVYETTQLINSLLGILVLPKEKSLKSIPKTSVEKLRNAGWEIPKFFDDPNLRSSYKHEIENLRQLAWRLRNAVAHFRMEFYVANEQLGGVTFWDQENNNLKPHFRITFSENELRSFVVRFANELLIALKKDLSK